MTLRYDCRHGTIYLFSHAIGKVFHRISNRFVQMARAARQTVTTVTTSFDTERSMDMVTQPNAASATQTDQDVSAILKTKVWLLEM